MPETEQAVSKLDLSLKKVGSSWCWRIDATDSYNNIYFCAPCEKICYIYLNELYSSLSMRARG